MAESAVDAPIPQVGRRRALEPEHEADRDGSAHQAAHGDPDDHLVPGLVDQAQQEQAQRPLGDGHADDGKSLPDGFEQNGFDEIVDYGDVKHVLPEAILGRDCCEDRIAEQEYLYRQNMVSYREKRAPRGRCNESHSL